jgi:tRNA G46 methylase TrmB
VLEAKAKLAFGDGEKKRSVHVVFSRPWQKQRGKYRLVDRNRRALPATRQ